MRRTIFTTLIAASTAVTLLVWLAGCGLTEPPGTARAAESTPEGRGHTRHHSEGQPGAEGWALPPVRGHGVGFMPLVEA